MEYFFNWVMKNYFLDSQLNILKIGYGWKVIKFSKFNKNCLLWVFFIIITITSFEYKSRKSDFLKEIKFSTSVNVSNLLSQSKWYEFYHGYQLEIFFYISFIHGIEILFRSLLCCLYIRIFKFIIYFTSIHQLLF